MKWKITRYNTVDPHYSSRIVKGMHIVKAMQWHNRDLVSEGALTIPSVMHEGRGGSLILKTFFLFMPPWQDTPGSKSAWTPPPCKFKREQGGSGPAAYGTGCIVIVVRFIHLYCPQ